jgi:hypothetical protein
MTDQNGKLFYDGQEVDPTTFIADGKDLSRLSGFCCICGVECKGQDAVPDVDPFESQVWGDETYVVECLDCRADQAMNI